MKLRPIGQKKKKGQVQDIFMIIGILFAVSLVMMVLSLFFNNLHDSVTGTTDNPDMERALDVGKNIGAAVDIIFIIIFMGYFIFLMVASMLADLHPVFYFLFFILVIIGVVVAVPISNAYNDLANNTALRTDVAATPMMDAIMGNLPTTIFLMAALGLVVMWAKTRLAG